MVILLLTYDKCSAGFCNLVLNVNLYVPHVLEHGNEAVFGGLSRTEDQVARHLGTQPYIPTVRDYSPYTHLP